MDFVSPDDGVFLSTMPATRSQRWLALAVVLIATGRIYGLMAVSVVLLVLLIELGRLYGQLVDKQRSSGGSASLTHSRPSPTAVHLMKRCSGNGVKL